MILLEDEELLPRVPGKGHFHKAKSVCFYPKKMGRQEALLPRDRDLLTCETQRSLRTRYRSHFCSPPVMANIRYHTLAVLYVAKGEIEYGFIHFPSVHDQKNHDSVDN